MMNEARIRSTVPCTNMAQAAVQLQFEKPIQDGGVPSSGGNDRRACRSYLSSNRTTSSEIDGECSVVAEMKNRLGIVRCDVVCHGFAGSCL